MIIVDTKDRSGIHYINDRALTFSENDLGDPQRIAVSLVSGAAIMVCKKDDGDGVSIPRAANGDYEKWALKAYSTKIPDGRNGAHYIFARLSRTDRTALVVFSLNNYNIDGSISTFTTDENGNEVENRTEASADYYYIRIGYLTETDGTSDRVLTYDCGRLSVGYEIDEVSAAWNKLFIPHYDDPTAPGKLTWIEAKSHIGVNGGVTMFIDNGSANLPSIYDGLPIDGTTIYWETITNEDGSTTKVLKSAGSGSGSGEGGTADFSNVLESGEGNAFTSFTLSEDKKTLTFVKGESFAKKGDFDALNTKITDFLEGSDTDGIINKWKELETFLTGMSQSDELATILSGKMDNKDFTKDKVKEVLGISDWALAATKPEYKFEEIKEKPSTLSEYGITDAYTKDEVNKEFGKYVTLDGKETITGAKDFTGGISVNGSPIVYDAEKGYWMLTGDLLVTGAITMFANEGTYTPSTIMDAILYDDSTLGINADGELYVKGGTDGGIVEITSQMVIDALGYTPYSASNPNGYITGSALNGYATQSWVTSQGYATASALTSGLNGKADKATTLAGYGITDAKISKGVITLGENTITPVTQSYVDDTFVTIKGNEDVTGEHDFTNGLYIGGIRVRKSNEGVMFIEGNLVVKGGITMYGTDSTSAPDVMSFLNLDPNTLEINSKGQLTVIGGTGGGTADSVAWENITGKPTFAAVATSGSYNDLLNKPTIPTSLKNPYALKFGSKTYDGSAAKEITASDLGALTSHQTIYNLTLQAGTFSATTFDPNGADKTVNIPTTTSHISEGSNLYFTNTRAQAAITGGASSIVTSNLTVSRVLMSDASGKVAASSVTSTELGYLDGVTSSIQTQLDGKLSLTGGTMTGEIKSQAIYPKTNNTYELGASSYLWSNFYTKKATIDGIGIYKSTTGVLRIDGDLVVSGGVTMYGTDSVNTSTVMDGVNVDGTTIIKEGGVLKINPNINLGGGEGSVTSVGLSAPTGFSVSGSPITSSGTLTLSFEGGYSLPTTTKQANWDTAYGWGNHASAGYLKTHQTLYTLTLQKNGTKIGTFKPTADATINITMAKGDVGLGNVENTALSTWTGSSKITTLGTITSGTWNGTKIENSYLANSAITISGTSVSLGGSITQAALRTALGLGSNAYTSTAYLPLSGGTMTGVITLTANSAFINNGSNGSILGFGTSTVFTGGDTTNNTVVGTISDGTTIRSSDNNLYHYNAKRASRYLIYDSYNTDALRMTYVDASALSSSNFYPLTFSSSAKPLRVKMYSVGGSSSLAYNNNTLEFTYRGQGWMDAPQGLTVEFYNCYQSAERTIGCIGMGQEDGSKVVWVRGGQTYYVYSNLVPTLRTANYTSGNEIYTVGTNLYGGTNTKVTVAWTPQTTSGLGAMYHNGGLALGGGILPTANNTNNIGSSSYKFANVYATTFNGALSGNAATATKLATASTIWGQSFDGSGNVSGDMTGVGSITMSGSINGAVTISSDTDGANIKGSGHYLYFGGSGYANQAYYFRPLYGSSGATTTSLYIQNASASSSPTFTTTHSFLSSGNATHSGTLTTGGAITTGGNILPATDAKYSIGQYGKKFSWLDVNCISSGGVGNGLWLCGGTNSGIGVVIARSGSNTATGELCRFTDAGMVWASGVVAKIITTAQELQLKYNNSDANSIVLSSTSFKPFTAATDNIMLGRYDSRWKGIYLGSSTSSANNANGVQFCDTSGYTVGRIGSSTHLGIYSAGSVYLRGGCTKGANGTMTISSTGVTIDASGNVTVSGNLLVKGGITMYGTDSSASEGISSDFLPSAGGAYSIGSYEKFWKELWVKDINVGSNGNIITYTNYTSNIGKIGGAFRFTYTNVVHCGSTTSGSLYLVGSSYAENNGVVIARNTTGDQTGEMARFNSSGLTLIGTLTQSSDIRYKNVHKSLVLPLDKMAEAPSIEYHFTEDEYKTTHIGTSAQYWQGVDGIVTKNEDGRLGMDYASLGVVMGISLAKELSKFESETDRRIRLLETENEELKKEIEKLKTA